MRTKIADANFCEQCKGGPHPTMGYLEAERGKGGGVHPVGSDPPRTVTKE